MIPKSYNDFTVEQFQKWHKVINTKFDNSEDRTLSLLAALTGQTLDEVKNTPFKDLEPDLKAINQIDEKIDNKVRSVIVVNKKFYVAITNHKQLRELMTQNQFEAAMEYSKTPESTIENMDKLLALMYSPYRFLKQPKLSNAQESTAKDFRTAKIKQVHGAVFFSSVVSQKYVPVLQEFLNQSTQTIANHLQEMDQDQDWQKHMAGILSETGSSKEPQG